MTDAEMKALEKHKAHQYHHIVCDEFRELKIGLSDRGRKRSKAFSVLGIASSRTIAEGLKAVDASPFQTVFVVSEKTGEVLFALSKNEDYVRAARKKKKPKPPVPPPPPPTTDCCRLCGFMGGTGCDDLADGSCICFGADRGIGGGPNDPLEVLAP
ncbi:hypothetical protein [Salinarimonas chemoclinalis]|uniref:hypothetical protein n=1 Tax=Salinarimonas chemoclinalis TaxID=3241599 RepID=UPI003558CDDD